jgi:hypothetical protein
MPITFKLVGNVNSKLLEIKQNITGTICLSNIITSFELLGMSSEDFKDIRIVHNSQTLDSDEKSFNVTETDDLTIFVFSTVKEIREKLGQLFLKYGSTIKSPELPKLLNKFPPLLPQASFALNEEIDQSLQKSIEDKEEETIPELSEEIITDMNKKTLKLFQDEDFCSLIKIYYTKPELIKTFMNFVSHGDIVNITIPKTEEQIDYSASINILKSLGLDSSNEEIGKALALFNGHLSLALRLILCQKAISF